MRQRLTLEKKAASIAAIFIYLNKTCFNGLYRVNKAGEFNVPMGDYKKPAILDEENLLNCSKALQHTEIYQHDFTQSKLQKGAFYYLDPPYHKTYNQYSGSGFGDAKHKELACFCHEIDKKGGFFMLSNNDTLLIRMLYKRYHIENVSASRSVSCKAEQRRRESELIIRNYK